MAHQVPWNLIILEEFIRIGALTEDEEKVMRTRVAGWPRQKQATKLGMSVSNLDKIIKRLKKKYDQCQPYSPILPPRRMSEEEKYMDEH